MKSDQTRFKLAGLPLAVTSDNFNRLIIAAVLLGFLAVAAAGGAALWAVSRDQALTRAVARSSETQIAISNVRVLLEQTETARRGYLLTRDPTIRQTFESTAALVPEALAGLDALTRSDPATAARVAKLRAEAQSHLQESKRSIAFAAGGGALADSAAQLNAAVGAMRALRSTMAELALNEDQRLQTSQTLQRASVRNLYLALGLAAPLLVVVAFGSTFVIFGYTRDLSQTGRALAELNEGLEEAIAERTAGLARANEEIQRFAYIVSHDLRSPLVNVMGFTAELETTLKPLSAMIDKVEAEAPHLLNADAAEAVRNEVPEAIGFIRKSTQKMDRLINAILNLSRSGRRQLKPEALDLGQVLGDVAAVLKTRADAAGAEIIVPSDLPKIVSDRLAVEQIFSNLMENAVKYRAPGRAPVIEVKGEQRPGRVVISVSDNGRGIDPKDHERIFELFRRSGVQDQPGEGIGLANVRALVYRIGGQIQCESAIDQGATFRVFLPPTLRAAREASS